MRLLNRCEKPDCIFLVSPKVSPFQTVLVNRKGESFLSGKVFVTCTVTISGLWSHSGTGEAWADDDNGMTSADAQAFKRACACFGLGRYFYDFPAMWVDLDQKGQPAKPPVLPSWALPENWRKGLRPPGRNGEAKPEVQRKGAKSDNSGGKGSVFSQPTHGNSENGERANGFRAADSGDELDQRILGMEKVVGAGVYRNILREYGRGQPTEADPRCSHKTKSAGDAGVGCTRDSAFGSCPEANGSKHRPGCAGEAAGSASGPDCRHEDTA